MRPLLLRFAGLRSYRTEQVIDFTDKDLVAVIGPTGAGKSSTLEALSFALYGTCTWDNRSARPLIADGGNGTLSAELTFRVAGRTWSVARTISRHNYPPSQHILRCLDDDAEPIDGADPVNDTIRRIIGLDHATFLRAVILPQGRFQELLHSPRTERTRRLKDLLDLDQITAIRDRADTLRQDLGDRLTDLQQHRHRLLPDPAAVITASRRLLRDAQQRHRQLTNTQDAITAARKEQKDALTRAAACHTAANSLTAAIPTQASGEYQRLIALDARLDDALSDLRRELAEAENNEHELDESLAAAEAAGTGMAEVASALSTLTNLADQLPEIDAEELRLQHDAATIATDRNALKARHAAQPALQTAADDAKATAERAAKALQAATQQTERTRVLLDTARTATSAATDAESAVDRALELVEQRRQAAEEARHDAEQAETDLARAAEHLEQLRLANAAAHAASNSHPGDPCPICSRDLPAEFVAPTAEGVETAQAAHVVANTTAKKLSKTAAKTNAVRETAEHGLTDARAAAGRARDKRDAAVAALRETLGSTGLAADDDHILEPHLAAAGQLAAQAEQLREQAAELHDAATRDAADLATAEKALAQRDDALARAKDALARRRAIMMAAVAQIAEPYRVIGHPTLDALTIHIQRATQRRAELEEITQHQAVVRDRTKTLSKRISGQTQRRRTEVEQPTAQLYRQIQTVADRYGHAADLTDAAPLPGCVGDSLRAEAQWAESVLSAARQVAGRCLREAAIQHEHAVERDVAAQAALAAAGLDSDKELKEQLVTAEATGQRATEDLQRAEHQLPIATELTRRIDLVNPRVASLRELVRLLADGEFVAAVVKRRQRALIHTATGLLKSMTGDRFAFSDDFRIIDGDTAQHRDVKTLSGGETFMASLALALAVVQLAGRGAGRVEALFLDEGFGTLDANALGEALEVLEQQTRGGRLVAVISHMRDVAVNMEHVLLVEKTLGGSRARWASPTERDQLVAGTLTNGLLE